MMLLAFAVVRREAPRLADLGVHPADDLFQVLEVGGRLGGVAPLAVLPAALLGGGGQLAQLVERVVPVRDLRPDRPVDRLDQLAAVLLSDLTFAHRGLTSHCPSRPRLTVRASGALRKPGTPEIMPTSPCSCLPGARAGGRRRSRPHYLPRRITGRRQGGPGATPSLSYAAMTLSRTRWRCPEWGAAGGP